MMSRTNPDRTPLASVAIADGMDTPYNNVERKLLMMKENANTIEKISRESQLSLMTTIREKDQIWDRKTITIRIPKTTTPTLNKGIVTTPVNRITNQNFNIQNNSDSRQNQRSGQNNYNFPARQNNNSNTQYNQNFPHNNSNALY